MLQNSYKISTNFLFPKVCWQRPTMFYLYTSSKQTFPPINLNFHWRWWDWIQAIFLIFFYFICNNIDCLQYLKCINQACVWMSAANFVHQGFLQGENVIHCHRKLMTISGKNFATWQSSFFIRDYYKQVSLNKRYGNLFCLGSYSLLHWPAYSSPLS